MHLNRQDYLVCLEGMSEDADENEDTYLEYTQRWIHTVDRGVLFRVNDVVYGSFYELEKLVHKHLLRLMTRDIELGKKDIVDEVTSDNSVQFHWSMIAADLDEEIGQQRLVEIVQLWLTVHGFSMAGAFLEHYIQVTKTSTRKSTSLRKGLKRKKLDMNTDDH